MDRVISLLEEKNDYLEKFYAVNEHELINFGAGDFENVEVFYQTRDKILDLVRCIDGRGAGCGSPDHSGHVSISGTAPWRGNVRPVELRCCFSRDSR